MPRYFFDIDDGEIATEDDDGLELHGVMQARDHAIAVLPDVAREVLPDGDRREFLITVRDEGGRRFFCARLAFRAEWLIDPAMTP